ncbi:MAG TPA: hypothetical protein VNV16_07440 [Methylibium sp.]|nr:hypothetical protein [Methylibium sp.]
MTPETATTVAQTLAALDKLAIADLATTLAGISLAVMTMAYGAFQASDAARLQTISSIRATPGLSHSQVEQLTAQLPDAKPAQRVVMRNLYYSVLLLLISVAASLGIDPFIEFEQKASGEPAKALVFNDAAAALPFLSIDILTQLGPFAFGCIMLFKAAVKLRGVFVQ